MGNRNINRHASVQIKFADKRVCAKLSKIFSFSHFFFFKFCNPEIFTKKKIRFREVKLLGK